MANRKQPEVRPQPKRLIGCLLLLAFASASACSRPARRAPALETPQDVALEFPGLFVYVLSDTSPGEEYTSLGYELVVRNIAAFRHVVAAVNSGSSSFREVALAAARSDGADPLVWYRIFFDGHAPSPGQGPLETWILRDRSRLRSIRVCKWRYVPSESSATIDVLDDTELAEWRSAAPDYGVDSHTDYPRHYVAGGEVWDPERYPLGDAYLDSPRAFEGQRDAYVFVPGVGLVEALQSRSSSRRSLSSGEGFRSASYPSMVSMRRVVYYRVRQGSNVVEFTDDRFLRIVNGLLYMAEQ